MLITRQLLALAGSVPWNLAASVAIGLAVTGTYVGQGVLLALVLSRVFRGEPFAALAGPLIGLGAVVLARAGLLWLAEVAAQRTGHAIKERVRASLYRKLLELGPGHVLQRRTGDVQATLVDGVEALEPYYGRYFPALALVVLGPAGIILFLATLDGWLAGLVALFAVLVPVAPALWLRALGTASQATWQAYFQLGADFLDSMQGLPTLKAFDAVGRRRACMRDKVEHARRMSMRVFRVAFILQSILAIGTVGGAALVVAVGAIRVANGSLEPFTLFTVLFLVREVFRPFEELNKQFHTAYMAGSMAERIDELLRASPPTPDPAAPAAVVPSPEPSVTFEAVTFSYDGRSEPALRGLSLSIRAGETVAIVGRSGAGKTTIVSLLLRFFDPQAGRILLGGHDLRRLPLDTVRAMFAVVSQDTYLFHGTIGENIGLARPGATPAEIEAAARAANAHDFIAALPDGYDTAIGERGLRLSGGQRQRIAIARALLKDAPILVLDEATSNVDAASEAAIQEALDRLTRNRTTIVIAHRLSTVREADRIVVLADGRAVEGGAHHELLDRRGEYARLIATQEAI